MERRQVRSPVGAGSMNGFGQEKDVASFLNESPVPGMGGSHGFFTGGVWVDANGEKMVSLVAVTENLDLVAGGIRAVSKPGSRRQQAFGSLRMGRMREAGEALPSRKTPVIQALTSGIQMGVIAGEPVAGHFGEFLVGLDQGGVDVDGYG